MRANFIIAIPNSGHVYKRNGGRKKHTVGDYQVLLNASTEIKCQLANKYTYCLLVKSTRKVLACVSK